MRTHLLGTIYEYDHEAWIDTQFVARISNLQAMVFKDLVLYKLHGLKYVVTETQLWTLRQGKSLTAEHCNFLSIN